MKVIVDTCVWSLALCRSAVPDAACVAELRELITELRCQIMGPIRQEILSGVKTPAQFETLRGHLRAFPDLPLTAEDHELAAEFFNINRRKGIQGSNTDFLICAAAVRNNMPIFTTDADFKLFQKHIPIVLHPVRALS